MKRFALPLLIIHLSLAVTFFSPLGLSQESKIEPHSFTVERDANVPDLPFEDNPDPSLCGIPEPWGNESQAWLSGYYEAELIQENVLLYDSHLRRSVVASAPTGTEIEILLFQSNPSLNYYLVRTLSQDRQEGWIPALFVNFEQP